MNVEEGNKNAPAPNVILERNIKEFTQDTRDKPFMQRLLDGVLAKQEDLDTVITKAAPEWPLDKIARVDRNILRIGLYELLFSDRNEVPAKVAINEAIELAKNFGGDSSGSFVNGVIGGVYKELGEPGKDETSKKKKRPNQPMVPYEKMPISKKAGAVVYAHHEGDIFVALVHDVFGHWTLSKGSVEENETGEEAAIREIKEEMDLDIKIVETLGENEYVASHPENGKIRKQVIYYLAESEFTEVTLEAEKGGLDDARWFKLADILDLNFYHDMLPVITKAINILLNIKKK
jgi:N utilization substance protein B